MSFVDLIPEFEKRGQNPGESQWQAMWRETERKEMAMKERRRLSRKNSIGPKKDKKGKAGSVLFPSRN